MVNQRGVTFVLSTALLASGLLFTAPVSADRGEEHLNHARHHGRMVKRFNFPGLDPSPTTTPPAAATTTPAGTTDPGATTTSASLVSFSQFSTFFAVDNN